MTKQHKNILFITSRADIGGGPKHLYNLIKYVHYNPQNCHIHIAAPLELPYGPHFKKLSQTFIDIPKRKLSLPKLINLFLLIQREKIDIIHSHGRGAGIYSRLIKILSVITSKKIIIIHTFHGIHQGTTSYDKIKILAERAFKHLTNIFICVSKDEKLKAIKYKIGNSNKIKVINNGIDFYSINKKINSYNNIYPPKKYYHSNNNEIFLVGTLARLDHQKGIDLLLHAASDFFQHFPGEKESIKFIIAGEGEEEEALHKLAQTLDLTDKVKFIGNIEKPQELLSSIDAYVSFSRGEGLPYAVLEAMSSSVPCILSNVSGHRNLMDDECGVLFNLDRPSNKDFSFALKRIKENVDYKDKLTRNALTKIKKNYTLESMVKKTFGVYFSA